MTDVRATGAGTPVSIRHPAALVGPFVYYLGAGLVALFIMLAGLRAVGIDAFDLPFIFQGDALHFLAVAKAIAEGGWWWTVDRLGAPFALDLRLFPVGTWADAAGFWLISRFTANPVLIVNTFWVGTFGLCAVTSAWSLRRLGVPPSAAFAGGLLFAFLPGAFFRATGHLMLVAYAVPPAVAMCLLVLDGRWQSLARRDRALFWAALALLGTSYVYYSFFACVAFSLVVLLAVFDRSRRLHLMIAGSAIALVTAVSFVQLAPSISAWRADPVAAANVSQKTAAEADSYGLKIRHLLLPREDHPVPLLRRLALGMHDAGFPLENENVFARLGLLAALGFLVLAFAALARMACRKVPGWIADLSPAAALNLWLLLFATIGGFGSLFNYLVSPSIRTYNRISPLIGFLGIYAVCHLIGSVERKSLSAPRRYVFHAALALLVLASIWDSSSFGRLAASWRADKALYQETRQFVAEVERRIPSAALVYQVPYTPYPHTPLRASMQAHQHLGAYVVSSRVRLSWPALSEKGITLNESLANVADPAILARQLGALGFHGVMIDRSGLQPAERAIEGRLTQAGSTLLAVSGSGRWAYYAIPTAPFASGVAHPRFSRAPGPLSEGAFRVAMRINDAASALAPGERAYVQVNLQNLGNATWHAGGDGANAMRVSYRWLAPSDSNAPFEARYRLHVDVPPGEAIDVGFPVSAPLAGGRYVLEVDLVQEAVAWFGDKGNARARHVVDVRK